MSGRSKVLLCLTAIVLSFSAVPASVAASPYVLPYPSYMPGNKLYKISRITDSIKGWWSWGTVAQITYTRSLSDKYLVEAKVLFEYGQYLLAVDALDRSDEMFSKLPGFIVTGTREGKNMNNIIQTISAAADEHVEVLTTLRDSLPEKTTWNPEHGEQQSILIAGRLDTAVSGRLEVARNVSEIQ